MTASEKLDDSHSHLTSPKDAPKLPGVLFLLRDTLLLLPVAIVFQPLLYFATKKSYSLVTDYESKAL